MMSGHGGVAIEDGENREERERATAVVRGLGRCGWGSHGAPLDDARDGFVCVRGRLGEQLGKDRGRQCGRAIGDVKNCEGRIDCTLYRLVVHSACAHLSRFGRKVSGAYHG